MLLAAVVGSGIMAERLAGGSVAVALLANTVASGAALVALILTFGTISGAHFNPAVTICDAWQKGISRRDAFAYIVAQTSGAFAGVATANVMFELPVFSLRKKRVPARRNGSANLSLRSACWRWFGVVRARARQSSRRSPSPLILSPLAGSRLRLRSKIRR
jgi:glycerol uptake facilitator-like aquaporin